MNSDAILHYHSLLFGSHAADAIEKLRAGTARYNLAFGDRAICTVLRPMLIQAPQYETIKRDSKLVLQAIERLGHALINDARLRAEMDLSPVEEQIVAIDPGYSTPDGSGRLDAFLDPLGPLDRGGGFHFVEYNADSPGGLLYGDALSEIFLEMDVVREFARQFPLRRIAIRPRILEMLLDSYHLWGGRDHPRIAIVDWNEVSTRAEFEICREYFEAQGYPTIIVDPNELEYRGGWLRAGSHRINIVYKRVVIGELLERGGLDHPLVRATRDRAVCTVNSFRAQMLTKKTLFALLDDPSHKLLFPAEELAALRRRIPWTRKLREGHTEYRNFRVDLLDFVSSNRDRLLLKPNGEYGGRGVVFGWECAPDTWQQAIRDALGASYVVQERVEVLRESFPTLAGDEIVFEDRYVDFNPYTWCGDEVEGAGVRLSATALLNVTAGGGSATPMLILE